MTTLNTFRYCSNVVFLLHCFLVITVYKGIEFLPQTIPISLQPDGANLWYFKLRILDLTEFMVWNIKVLSHRVSEILELKNQSMWQKLSFFTCKGREAVKLIYTFSTMSMWINAIWTLWKKSKLISKVVFIVLIYTTTTVWYPQIIHLDYLIVKLSISKSRPDYMGGWYPRQTCIKGRIKGFSRGVNFNWDYRSKF